MQATILRPNETLENRLIEIYERFDGGEEGFVRRALIDGKNYVLKEFKDNNDISVQNSYNALNELKSLGFKIIEDYGIVKTDEGKNYLLLKDLGNRVWAEQGNGRGLPFLKEEPEVLTKIRRNKLLCAIYGIRFGISDEHMIYENEKGEFDASIVDVGMFHKVPFEGVLAQKFKREEFKCTDFKYVYAKMLENKKLSEKILSKYEKSFPGKLEEMTLEYEAFISSCFHIKDVPNEKLAKWAKTRGYYNPNNFLQNVIYKIDELYFFENMYKKKLLSLNISDFDDFDKFEINDLNNKQNLDLAYKGVDIAFINALDRDISRMDYIYQNGFDYSPKVQMGGRFILPNFIMTLDFDKNNKVLAKVCMDPGSFRRERRGNNIFYADILVPVERAFSGVRGLVNPGAFSPDDIKGFSSTRFVNAKGGIGLDIKERDFKLKQKVERRGDSKFGYGYYITRPNGDKRIIHMQYEE